MTDNRPLALIVDDDADWSDVLAVSLEKLGCETHNERGASGARAWLASNRPALILLDIMMPDGNGLDLCRWIRSQKEFERIPVLINSGVKDDETVELALELGAVDFLRKPVRLEALREKVERLLSSKPRSA